MRALGLGGIGAFLVALALVGTAGASAASGASGEKELNLAEIESEVMCPICGVPLEMAREAPQAKRQRVLIRRLIDEGHTKEEIKDRLIEEYGSDVLAVPGASGFDLAAWAVPGAGLGVAALAIAVGVRRWRRSGSAGVGDDGPEPARLDAADAARLDAELRRGEG